jgi:hypothetical protein
MKVCGSTKRSFFELCGNNCLLKCFPLFSFGENGVIHISEGACQAECHQEKTDLAILNRGRILPSIQCLVCIMKLFFEQEVAKETEFMFGVSLRSFLFKKPNPINPCESQTLAALLWTMG